MPPPLAEHYREGRSRVLEAVVEVAAMALADRRVLTFDVVGTLIDFEAGILGCLREIVDRAGKDLPDPTLLDAFARAEDAQQHVSPEMPFTQMLHPIYERIASELGLPLENGEADRLASSIPEWPAFPDAIDGLAKLGARYRLVALTNADNWALEHMSRTLGGPFDDPSAQFGVARDQSRVRIHPSVGYRRASFASAGGRRCTVSVGGRLPPILRF